MILLQSKSAVRVNSAQIAVSRLLADLCFIISRPCCREGLEVELFSLGRCLSSHKPRELMVLVDSHEETCLSVSLIRVFHTKLSPSCTDTRPSSCFLLLGRSRFWLGRTGILVGASARLQKLSLGGDLVLGGVSTLSCISLHSCLDFIGRWFFLAHTGVIDPL